MLIGLTGRMGTGKTLLSIFISCALQEYYNNIGFGYVPIYSNIASFNLSRYIENFKDLWDIKKGIVILDEAWIIWDSRLWKNNVAGTRWIQQSRKKQILLIYNTQHIGQIDKRIRQATEIIGSCKKLGSGKHKVDFYEYLDNIGYWKGKSFIIDDLKQYFNKYDTEEIIKPLGYT